MSNQPITKAKFICIDPRIAEEGNLFHSTLQKFSNERWNGERGYCFTLPGGLLAFLMPECQGYIDFIYALMMQWNVDMIDAYFHFDCKAARELAERRGIPYNAETEKMLGQEARQKALEYSKIKAPSINLETFSQSADGTEILPL